MVLNGQEPVPQQHTDAFHGGGMGQMEPASEVGPTIGGKFNRNPTGPIDTDSQR